jgi:acetyl-CoA carboxylase, biotin carboxylase subunit
VALGNELSFKQNELHINGHSIECRIYAEDPFNKFLPTTGNIITYSQPSGPGVRVDSGFGIGSQITVHYDPLISKLVCWAKDRNSAVNRMLGSLSEYVIGGLITNISFLKIITDHSSFRSGKFDINFLNEEFMRKLDDLNNNQGREEAEKAAAILSGLLKSNSSLNNQTINHKETSNFWQEQLYE